MPQVPRLNPDPVATAPLPGARVPTDIPARAFGSPEQPDLTNFQRQATELVQRERDKADTTALLDADNKLATLQTDAHTAAIAMKGKDALNAVSTVKDQWTKGVADITNSLGTDQQRRAFAARVGSRWGTLYQAVATHAEEEHQAYVEQTAGDALKVRLQHATEFYQQPGVVTQSIDETKAILHDAARVQGWSDETLEEKTAAAVTGIHASVIDRMVANHQDLNAAAYLTAHRDEMTGQQLIQAEHLVNTGSILGAGQRAADGILKTATTMQGALTQAALITDPQVRQETEERIRRGFEDRRQSTAMQQLQDETAAGQIIRKTGHYSDIPAKLLNALTPQQIDGLKLLERTLARRTSDPSVLLPLRNMAGLQTDEFIREDLSQYAGVLSEQDYRALSNKQLQLRLAKTKAQETQRQRQGKELTKLQTEQGFYNTQKLPVPDQLTRHIKALTDSIHGGTAAPPTPGVPGAPLRPAAPAGPAGSGALPAFTLPGSKPPEPDDELAMAVDVPSTWLEHARTNPDYAAYLETMGVSV